jgi:hypothetical protein
VQGRLHYDANATQLTEKDEKPIIVVRLTTGRSYGAKNYSGTNFYKQVTPTELKLLVQTSTNRLLLRS